MLTLKVYIAWQLWFDAHINSSCSRVDLLLKRFYSLNVHTTIPIKIRVIVLFIPYGLEVHSSTNTSNLKKLRQICNRIINCTFSLKRCDHISGYFLGCFLVNFIKVRLLFNLYNIILREPPKELFSPFSFSRSVHNNHSLVPKFFQVRRALGWILPTYWLTTL